VCQFRDALSKDEVFHSTHAQVIGVSPDPVQKQKEFAEKQGVTYPILSDEKGEARKAYQVSRGLMGLTGSTRVTFVIDADGVVQDAFDSVLSYNAHSKFVHTWLEQQAAAAQTTTVKGDPEAQKAETTGPPAAAPEPEPAAPAPVADAPPAAAAAAVSKPEPEPPASTPEAPAEAPAPPAAATTTKETEAAPEPPAVPAPMLDPAAGAPTVPVPTTTEQTVA